MTLKSDLETIGISETRMRHILLWMHKYSRDWTIQGEVPMRIHESRPGQHFGLGSAPPFAGEFVGYIGELTCDVEGCRECDTLKRREGNPYSRNTQTRTRTTRAFRKLRRFAPREFDAVYLAVVHQQTLNQIAESFTGRSYARGFDETFDRIGILTLIVSGMDKLEKWY